MAADAILLVWQNPVMLIVSVLALYFYLHAMLDLCEIKENGGKAIHLR